MYVAHLQSFSRLIIHSRFFTLFVSSAVALMSRLSPRI